MPECREVTAGPHRADIMSRSGLVIELQHSPIAPSEIREREAFYGNMVWVLDGSEFKENLVFRYKSDGVAFRWKWARRSWLSARRPIYIDLGSGVLFRITWLGSFGGTGHFTNAASVVANLLGCDASHLVTMRAGVAIDRVEQIKRVAIQLSNDGNLWSPLTSAVRKVTNGEG